MSRSVQEEILAALYLIAALLAFQFGPAWLGWVCAVKACLCIFYALFLAVIEARELKETFSKSGKK